MKLFYLRVFDPEFNHTFTITKHGESESEVSAAYDRETQELGLCESIVWISADPAGPVCEF